MRRTPNAKIREWVGLDEDSVREGTRMGFKLIPTLIYFSLIYFSLINLGLRRPANANGKPCKAAASHPPAWREYPPKWNRILPPSFPCIYFFQRGVLLLLSNLSSFFLTIKIVVGLGRCPLRPGDGLKEQRTVLSYLLMLNLYSFATKYASGQATLERGGL